MSEPSTAAIPTIQAIGLAVEMPCRTIEPQSIAVYADGPCAHGIRGMYSRQGEIRDLRLKVRGDSGVSYPGPIPKGQDVTLADDPARITAYGHGGREFHAQSVLSPRSVAFVKEKALLPDNPDISRIADRNVRSRSPID